MRKNRFISALLGVLLVVSMAGCHGPGTPEGHEGHDTESAPAAGEAKPQRLVIAAGHGLDYLGVDPFGLGRENTLLSTAIYEPLALENPDGKIEPALAESWSTSADGLEWTFRLRQGVKFHDGTDFEAKAVEVAFRHYLQDKSTAQRLGIKQVTVVDPHTIIFALEKPSATFLGVIGSFSAVIPSPTAHDGSGKLLQPIGTGPFQVKSHSRQQVDLVANEGHWRGRPKLDEVVIRYLPDPATMVLSLEAGEVDLIGVDGYGVPFNELKQLQSNRAFQVAVDLRDTSIVWTGFNLKRPPLDDIRVRQAISYAVDRKAMVDHLLEGFGTAAVGPLDHDPQTPWVNEKIAGYPYDLDKARALLADAGWRDSNGNGTLDKDGKELAISLMFEGTRDWKLYAETLQQDLAKAGVKLELQMRDYEVMRDLQKQGSFDLVALSGIGKSRIEPSYYFFYYYSSRGGATVIRDNKKLDGMISKLSATLNQEEREKLYHQIQEEIWAMVPGVYLLHPARVSVVRAGVTDWRSAGTMDPLRWLYLVSR